MLQVHNGIAEGFVVGTRRTPYLVSHERTIFPQPVKGFPMQTHALNTTPLINLPRNGGTKTLFRALKEWYVARQTRRALMQLTQRELADIGVTPGTIDEIAMRSARHQ